MHTLTKLDATPHERLVESESRHSHLPPFAARRALWIALGGIFVMIAVIAIAWAAGSAAYDFIRQYSEWLTELAAPATS